MLSDAYIAGLFDGEGSVIASFASGRPLLRTVIASNHRGVLELVQERFGGGLQASLGGHHVAYFVSIEGPEQLIFLKAILPFLVIKKRQAELALELRSRIDRRKRATSDEQEVRESLVWQIRELSTQKHRRTNIFADGTPSELAEMHQAIRNGEFAPSGVSD